MSDDPSAAKKSTEGPQAHLCEHPGCKKWGGFGFPAGGLASVEAGVIP
ncbi:hypothetical protein [Rhizobiales bacterium]